MSFGLELYSSETYRKIHFVGTPSKALFKKYFPNLKNTYQDIEASKLALYHAYCSMAGNFPQILWTEISKNFEKDLDISADSLKPYLKQITSNFISNGETSVTGPLVRNENRTLIRHLDALANKPLQGIYFSFMNLFRKNHKMEKPHESRGISSDQI